MNSKKNRAFTLVEALVVIAIITTLAAIVFSVIIASKQRGKVTQDTSAMRQIGQAAEIYSIDNNDQFTESAAALSLADKRLAPLLLSKDDNFGKGYVHAFYEDIGFPLAQRFDTPWPVTFLGLRDAGWTKQKLLSQSGGERNPGWLINVIRSKPDPGRSASTWPRSGPYHRLLFDGSVQTRHKSADEVYGLSFHYWFHD